jgi:nucleoside-diphosphate-sugar epimerase
MRVLITGAAGFIGSHLVQACTAHSYEVIALSRSSKHTPGGVAKSFHWSFGDPLPADPVQDVNCAIHLAHDFDGEDGARRTIESTLSVVAALRLGGVPRQLFFSSYSAGEDAPSLYGKTKLMIERAFEHQEDIIIVRPGLVLGEGGIYGRIRRLAPTALIIPLPDGGNGKIPIIGIGDLCERTLRLAATIAPRRRRSLCPNLT